MRAGFYAYYDWRWGWWTWRIVVTDGSIAREIATGAAIRRRSAENAVEAWYRLYVRRDHS